MRQSGEKAEVGHTESSKTASPGKETKYSKKTHKSKEKGKIVLQVAFQRTKGYAAVRGDKEQETSGMRRDVTVRCTGSGTELRHCNVCSVSALQSDG